MKRGTDRKEAEVSLRVAIHYILEEKTDQDVMVSLDGAHIKTGAQVHFDVPLFLSELGWVKVEGAADSWQGTYAADGIRPRLTVCSQPGVGDVTIQLKDGRQLRVECKKGTAGNKSGSEYPLMREAIGQLMTGCELTDKIIPVVAVPYTERSMALASKWSAYSQIKAIGLQFLLVHENGGIVCV